MVVTPRCNPGSNPGRGKCDCFDVTTNITYFLYIYILSALEIAVGHFIFAKKTKLLIRESLFLFLRKKCQNTVTVELFVCEMKKKSQI